jgi:hypothetical protein
MQEKVVNWDKKNPPSQVIYIALIPTCVTDMIHVQYGVRTFPKNNDTATRQHIYTHNTTNHSGTANIQQIEKKGKIGS